MAPYATALTVAGSDSGGGAGIQADLKTFLAHGVFGMSAITAITAQSSRGVTRVDPLPVEGLVAQLEAVFGDFPVGAVKIGMLASPAHAEALAAFLERLPERPPIVLDPVLVASTGQRLTEARAEAVLRDRLMPLATVATPNREEAAVLAGTPEPAELRAWAERQRCAVLITGGDTERAEIEDLLVEGGVTRTWRHPRLGTRPFHGTGCTLASAVAARLSLGHPLGEAVELAIDWLQNLLREAERVGSIGHGNPSLPHHLSVGPRRI